MTHDDLQTRMKREPFRLRHRTFQRPDDLDRATQRQKGLDPRVPLGIPVYVRLLEKDDRRNYELYRDS